MNRFATTPRDLTSLPAGRHGDLLRMIGVLHRTTPRTPPFNMLRALRGESDEVRLHSRMIAALIDPEVHTSGHALLREFLAAMEIPSDGPHAFELSGLKVHVEYAGIDILVTNGQRQALLIENKVYADDQDRQLRRYHDLLKQQGYGPIFVRYLTIDGRAPSPQSLAGLEVELAAPYLQYVSYVGQVRSWLRDCESIAVREVSLRESISQYAAVIDQLTGNDQERGYMDAMVETLLIGETMLVAKDIRAGYERALVELQERLWSDIKKVLARDHPAVLNCLFDVGPESSPERKTIEKYYRPAARNNRNYGLYFRVPGWEDACVGIEIEEHICCGVYCDKAVHGGEYKRARQVLGGAGLTGEFTDTWPIWQWCGAKYKLGTPDDDALRMLTDESKRAAFAKACVDGAVIYWQALQVR